MSGALSLGCSGVTCLEFGGSSRDLEMWGLEVRIEGLQVSSGRVYRFGSGFRGSRIWGFGWFWAKRAF